MSNIEWTEKTWNPIAGCTAVSPGCTNFSAVKMASRIERNAWHRLDICDLIFWACVKGAKALVAA
jgi:protein gp37